MNKKDTQLMRPFLWGSRSAIRLKITKEQQIALKRVFDRTPLDMTDLQFRRTAFNAFDECVMVYWCGILLGIERDGYTHS